jgi:hypothetical protein
MDTASAARTLIFAFLSLAALVIVMTVRQVLVRRGLMKPPSATADQPDGHVRQGADSGVDAGSGAGN